MIHKVCEVLKHSFSSIFTSSLFIVLNQILLNTKARHKIAKMTTPETRTNIDTLAKDFIAIEESAPEDVFRKAFAMLEKEYANWQWMSPGLYGTVINNLAYFTSKYGKPQDVVSVLERYYPDYDKACHYDYQNKCIIHEAWAKAYVELDVESFAYEHLKHAAFNQFVDNYSYDGFEFFSFRDFTQYAMDDIIKNTICLSHPSTFNDPMDTILLQWNKYLIDNAPDATEKRLRMLYQKVYDHIKVRCFVRTGRLPREKNDSRTKLQLIEDVNSLMWAHYANYHKGFCIKYKFPAQLLRNEDKKTLSWSRVGNVNYLPEMKFQTNSISLLDALFAKHSVWQYENEVRLIHYDPNDDSNYKTIQIPEDCIQAIYLGLKCSDENRERMKLLLRNRNIRLYQMSVNGLDSYKLIKERIL